jgi:hypothetical protein
MSFGLASDVYEPSLENTPLRQGEILTEVVQLVIQMDSIGLSEPPVFDRVRHPFAIVISQDCDLDWDYKENLNLQEIDVDAIEDKNEKAKYLQKMNKLIPNIFLCMADHVESLRFRDDHFPVGTTREITAKAWTKIQQNKDERYHFLQSVSNLQDALGDGLPELGCDFKKYFSIPARELYKRIENGEAIRRCVIKSPYKEHFIRRFYNFQSRVALPEEHYSE